jgi:hypothetical protein
VGHLWSCDLRFLCLRRWHGYGIPTGIREECDICCMKDVREIHDCEVHKFGSMPEIARTERDAPGYYAL